MGGYIALQLPGNSTTEPIRLINFAELQAFGYEIDTTSEGSMPVQWGPFSAIAQKSDVLLKWSTVTEINNKSFDIEKLDNDNQFKKIASLSANNSPSDYDYIDVSPRYGANIYRLKQYDTDGKFSYSSIRTVIISNNSNNNDFLIQPNPVSDVLKIIKSESVTGRLSFRITDAAGRKISAWSIESPGTTIEKNVSSIASGVYFLQILTNAGTVHAFKFIKN